MPRFFNTSGPNDPADHYTLSIGERLPGIRTLIDRKLYFVLHAPRQVGKTTALLALAQELTAAGRFTAVLLSMEQGASWLAPDGSLDEMALLQTFLEFWRQHGEPLLGTAPYHEIAPHLVLMAFLHRVVNGGSIEREYATGRGRMDLCVRYRGNALAIEIRVWRPKTADPLRKGLEQLDGYLARLGLDAGWLVIFDRRPQAPPLAERLGVTEVQSPGGRRVSVIRA